MTFIPIPDAWRVSVSGHAGVSVPWAMVFCVRDFQAHDGTRAGELHSVFRLWAINDLLIHLCNSISVTEMRILDISSAIGPSFEYPESPSLAGGVAGPAAGSQVCAMVTLLSGNRGRSHRGRKYVPGIAASMIDATAGTSLEATTVDVLQNAFGQLRLAISAMSGGPVLAIESKKVGSAIPVTSVSARFHLGGQRRRRDNAI